MQEQVGNLIITGDAPRAANGARQVYVTCALCDRAMGARDHSKIKGGANRGCLECTRARARRSGFAAAKPWVKP